MNIAELIRNSILEILEDWDQEADGEIGESTRLSADLCFSSVEMMHLLAKIDMKLGRKLPYEKLLQDGDTVRSEMTLGALIAFINEHATAAPASIVRTA
ncbi:hypothetical protein NAC44_08630 [Allorhizobium sp. BGMRC 0089]|uniref:hypothetical protein n=1 Tax=Allorhizobium sonneratiae TaxID=2934936 RepID=UPI0020335EBA|nr:hypothetical protein [Allorhizobium sonneratiae]MCM2292394.1 hypothetical protein [Allorhizobium sonneratiae]